MTNKTARQPKRRVFYGYYLVAVAFLFMVLFSGCGVFAFSLFVRPLDVSLGWGRGQVMAGFTLFYLMVGLASPVVGRFVDRYGARPVMPVGGVLMGLGFVIVSQMDTLYLFYFGYTVVGIGASAMGLVPCSAVISNWFKRKRGTAVGLMAGGIGAGGVVMAPFVGYMLSHFDWRAAYLAMGVLIIAVTVPLSLCVIRTRPSEKGLYPDGDSAPPVGSDDPTGEGGDKSGFTLKQAMKSRAFWLIAVALAFSNFANMSTLQSSAPFLEDIGFPTAVAASAVGVIGLGSGTGKILFGWLCDRIQAHHACAIGIALQLSAVLLLLFTVHADSPTALIWAYALLLGLGIGAWLPTLSMLSSTNFGLLFYGAVFGALNLAQSMGTATGPLFSGLVHDAVGSYMGSFIAAAFLLAVAIPAILMVKKPVRPMREP
ncbi:MAG: MFS transporter [Dehalococcoidia bacterium]|nr:MFS transporter [Dehalococcoidia bacterium]